MTIYIGFLRGINVGGNHKVSMAELKMTLESMGMNNVKTYINSGNVLFESEHPEAELRISIESRLEAKFGFPIPTVLRTDEELSSLIEACPFDFDSLPEGASIHLNLLSDMPPDEDSTPVSGTSESDEYQLIGRNLYQRYEQSILDSKLLTVLPKWKHMTMTSRNWKTILKMSALAQGMRK